MKTYLGDGVPEKLTPLDLISRALSSLQFVPGGEARQVYDTLYELMSCVSQLMRSNSAMVGAMLNTEDELHNIASAILDSWEGSDGKESIRVILDQSADDRAPAALGQIDALADKALAIYRRRVSA